MELWMIFHIVVWILVWGGTFRYLLKHDNVVGVVSFGYFCLYLGVSFVMGLFWPITIGMWIGQLILALAYKIYLKGKIK